MFNFKRCSHIRQQLLNRHFTLPYIRTNTIYNATQRFARPKITIFRQYFFPMKFIADDIRISRVERATTKMYYEVAILYLVVILVRSVISPLVSRDTHSCI